MKKLFYIVCYAAAAVLIYLFIADISKPNNHLDGWNSLTTRPDLINTRLTAPRAAPAKTPSP